MIRVVVADDHHLVRQGIRALLEKAPDISVVGEAEDGFALIDRVAEMKPDVVVVDVAMPGLNGVEAVRRITKVAETTRVVILSVHSDEVLVRQALRFGVNAYLLKDALKEDLLNAVRSAQRGETYLSPSIAHLAGPAHWTKPEPPTALERLSPREREVLQLIAEGHTNKRIALKLGVSEKTVEKHRANLMVKLQIRDVTGLVRFAIQHRLVFLDHPGESPSKPLPD